MRMVLLKRFGAIFFLFCFCLIGAKEGHTSCHDQAQEKSAVSLGVDLFFTEGYVESLRGKKVGLITNHTGINRKGISTLDLFLKEKTFSLVALFAPEHGLKGEAYAAEKVKEEKTQEGIPVYSLHGETRRPTQAMLQNLDVLVYDIQDIGCRSYTYATTLFYAMEEAAKKGIQVIVLDRPNPLGGLCVDGPMLQEKWRSFIGYIDVPYCHGMTLGELALFFNAHYEIGCSLQVVPMKGWKRQMTFSDTGLIWIPTSPHIPEPTTPFFYVSTGILGELGLVNIGVGYTLPFKLVGAPWIQAEEFAEQLTSQKLPGVRFLPFHYRPFYGMYKGETCHGVLIVITDPHLYRPLATQYLILGLLKTLYPKEVEKKLAHLGATQKKLFCQANGNEEMFSLLEQEKYIAWKLIGFEEKRREAFLELRKPYLLYE